MICKDYGITDGDIVEWLSRSWGSLVYDDEQTRAEAAIPEDKPTQIIALMDLFAFMDGKYSRVKCGNTTMSFTGIISSRDLMDGVSIKAGSVFTTTYKNAKFLSHKDRNSEHQLFKIIETGGQDD